MKDPRRLLDDSPSAYERALLDAGVSYRCSQDVKVKTLAAVGLAGSAAVTATAVGVAGTSWFAKIGWTKLMLGVSAIGVVTAVPAGYKAWQRHQVQSAELSTMQVPPSPGDAELVTPAQAPLNSNVVQNEAAPSTQESEAFINSKPVTSAKLENKTDAPPAGLAEELTALDAARSTLSRGDSSGALARLDTYNRTYPKGRLRLEAEVMRIDALNKNGQVAVAKKRAGTFLRKYPNSVLASRVRAIVGP